MDGRKDNMEYIARQVPPDTQVSNWDLNYDEIEYMALDDNMRYSSKVCSEYKHVTDFLDELKMRFNSLEELWSFTREKLPKTPELSPDEIEDIWHYVDIFEDGLINYRDAKLMILSIYTGHDWRCVTIHGSSQSEYQNLYYDSEIIPEDDIPRITKDFFNMGTEWEIFEVTPKADKHLFNTYCYGYSNEEIKAEICSSVGCKLDELKLLRFKEYEKIPKYEECV